MNIYLRTFVAIIIGLVIGAVINMSVVMIGPILIPPPPGTNLTTTEGLILAMPLMEPKHFLMPFLAHAFGTLAGASLAALIQKAQALIAAMVVGLFFLAGGIMMVGQLPSPLWFNTLDLGLAYVPMAFAGYRLSKVIAKG